jgi:cell division protein FtsB
MSTRIVPVLLIALLAILHGQLWFGRGSVPNVAKLQREIDDKKRSNAQASLTNDRLAAEINDLREGLEMVEEKARSELGMVKNNEIFVQIAK